MPHMRVEPMKELQNLTERLKKFAEEFPESVSLEFGRAFEPRVDVLVDAEKVYVQVELPGVPKEQVSLSFVDDAIVITGEKAPVRPGSNAELVRGERNFGAFERRIPMPVKIQRDSIGASMINGVLEITASKVSESVAKEINISIG